MPFTCMWSEQFGRTFERDERIIQNESYFIFRKINRWCNALNDWTNVTLYRPFSFASKNNRYWFFVLNCRFLPSLHSFIHSFIQTDYQTVRHSRESCIFFKGDEETKGSGWVEVNLLERFLVYSYNIIYTNNQTNMLNSCFPLFSFSSLFALFLFFNKLQGRCKPHTLSISGSANSI